MKRAFPTEIVLSLTTGYLLTENGFTEMHELAEHVLGHPVWTHEFADRALWGRLKDAIHAQHPRLRDAEVFDAKSSRLAFGEYVTGYVATACATFGATLDIERGAEERTESPLKSAARLMPGKPIVGVVAGRERGGRDGT